MIEIFIWGVVCAGISGVLDLAYNQGHILEGYYLWVQKNFGAKKIGKPLGLCIYCQNIYITLLLGLMLWGFGLVAFWAFIPMSFISHVVLRRIIT
jgi:hypothetical protein